VITPAEFLDINARVGSWKEANQMVVEGFPFVGGFSPANFDPWSSRNMNLSPDGGVTPRRVGAATSPRSTRRTTPACASTATSTSR
jgi:hypothetical protein